MGIHKAKQTHELRGAWGRGLVTEHGGCVLSWAPATHGEVLYVAGDAEIPGKDLEMWHGGIPVCAPWFGGGRGAEGLVVPFTHGLVSRVRWKVVDKVQGDEESRITLGVDADAYAKLDGADLYPDDLEYRLVVAMGATLTVTLAIASPSQEVIVDPAFHPYLRMDAREAVLYGLEGVAYVDAAGGWIDGVEDQPLRLGRYLDRIYAAAPPVRVADGSRTLRIDPLGASTVVVWNPGPHDDRLPEGAWTDFACVEYGAVREQAVTIPAGGTHTLGMTISIT